jgi:putative membrane protein
MRRSILFATCAFGVLAAPTAFAQMATPSAQEFVMMAASSDMFEIQSSTIALEKAQSEEVKEFAQQMIDDHTKASTELKAAVESSEKDLEVPESMLEKHQEQVEALNSASGSAFDAAYLEAQTAAHEEAVALMTSYAKGGEEAELKAHAAKAQPIVEMHLEHVQKLDQSM